MLYFLRVVDDLDLPAACGWIAHRVENIWYVFVKASRCPADQAALLRNIVLTLSGRVAIPA